MATIDFSGKILTTRNYAQFKTLFGNRFINPGHVRKIVASLATSNLLSARPVLVTKDGYVIDGQHRIEAAKQLGLEVPYVIVPDSDLDTVQMLNSNVKAWTLRDFCESHVKKGNEDYVKLMEFSSQYDLPLSIAASLLTSRYREGGNFTEMLRAGDFKADNLDNAKEMMRRLAEIHPFADAGSWKKREFIRALLSLYARGMDHSTLIEQLKKTGKRIQRQASNRDYLFHILDIYNYGLKTNRISLIDE
jgi:hypothetical protein